MGLFLAGGVAADYFLDMPRAPGLAFLAGLVVAAIVPVKGRACRK